MMRGIKTVPNSVASDNKAVADSTILSCFDESRLLCHKPCSV